MREARRARSLQISLAEWFLSAQAQSGGMEMERGPLSQASVLPLFSREAKKNVKTAPRAKEIQTSPSNLSTRVRSQKILTAPGKRLGDAATLVGEINAPIGLERRVTPLGERVPIKLDNIFTPASAVSRVEADPGQQQY